MRSGHLNSAEAIGRDTVAVAPWLARVGRVSWLVGVPVLATFVIRELLAGKLGGAALDLSRASLAWVGVAVVAEVLSYLLYAAAQRRLLGADAGGIGVRWLTSLAVCAQGVNNFVPAGYIAANVLNFRELRRRGVAPDRGARLLVASSALYIGALALLTVIAGEIAGDRAGNSLEGARIGAGVVLAGLPVGALVGRRLVRRGVIRLPQAWRVSGRRQATSWSAPAAAALLFASSWLADAGCLVGAIHAVGAHPDWTLVPIAYCAAQLVSFLPITPGGLGLVEGSLTVTLMSGGGAPAVLAAVLLYRLISYWGTLPFGVLGYLAVRRAGIPGSTRGDGHRETTTAPSDRAPGGDRPLLVLER
jgi:uncharacterized membrane protein YbhN (UPF0104 family)